MATLMERLAFLQKVPTLMKATADDETPCPGYLFEEIGKISHESVGCCQCLLEYLLERLQVESCHVKLKVLKILLHLCGLGPPHFLTELRRNATFIQEVTVYSGPPDPIHGNAHFQRVRMTAQELASVLFTDTVSPESGLSPCKAATPSMGMGSESSPRSGMQGFGYSPGKKLSGGATLLDKIQKAAEVMASAVLPPTEQPGIRLQDNHYRAVVAPFGAVEVAEPACAYSMPAHSQKVARRCPGQAGGGWEENDSGHSSSQNSSQENGPMSRVSVGGSSKSGGTDSHSAASRESGDLSERMEAMQLGDCGQEMALINSLTDGPRVFLSREESQRFITECSTLNCEVVVELLSRKLQDSSETVQMRALCAVACLMSSDLLSLDQIFSATHRRLDQLSDGTTGPVANKATKLLRQFEALMGGLKGVRHAPAVRNSPLLSEQPLTDLLLPTPLTVSATPGTTEEPPTPAGHTSLSTAARLQGEGETEATGEDQAPHRGGVQEQENPEIGRSGEVQDSTSTPCEGWEPSRAQQPPLSLFSGMELVNRGRPVCLVEPVLVESDGRLGGGTSPHPETDLAITKSPDRAEDSSAPAMSELQQSGQEVSAFSFLNL